VKGFVDLHAHVLPGIDDGAPDLESSLAMLRAAAESGTTTIASTPLVWALQASDEDLRLASYDQRGTDLLIETPSASVAGLDTLLYQLRVKGLRVTLAHPERNGEFQRDPEPLESLHHQGVLLQINAQSLLAVGEARLGAWPSTCVVLASAT
jgi:protein-tyrosine phosphatase